IEGDVESAHPPRGIIRKAHERHAIREPRATGPLTHEGLEGPLPHEGEVKRTARSRELLGGVEDNGMPLHDAKAGHEPDDGHALRHSKFGMKSAGARGPETLAVRSSG